MLILETLVDAARARLVAAGLVGGNVVKHRDPPTRDAKLPLAGITYDNDTADADGDPRTGTSDFTHKLTLVVDIIDTAGTGAALMTKLAQHGEHVMRALCIDPWNWSGNVVEGIGGVRHITERSAEGAQIIYRRQVQVDVLYRSQWEPDASGLPDFTTLSVDAGDGLGATIPVPTE